MKKKQKTSVFTAHKKLIAASILLAVIILITAISIGVAKVSEYNRSVSQTNIIQIRELILLAARGVKKDAPVDPKTGDVYFPESKLFLPNPKIPLTLTYLLDSGDITDSQSELSVSTYPIRGTEKLYEAKDTRELFAAVPKLQACSRGIKIAHQQFPVTDDQNELKHTVRLNNGQTVYIYVEKGCPELNPTADLFVNVQSY